GAVQQDADGADAVVGADVGTEGGGGATQFEGDVHLFFHGHTQATEVFRNGQAEQAQFLHLFDDVGRHFVGFRHFFLTGNEGLVDELADGVEQDLQGFRVADHV